MSGLIFAWTDTVGFSPRHRPLMHLIAHAHSARPGTLDRGPLAKEPSARIRDQHGGNIASKFLSNCSKMVPTWLPNGPWRSLGGLLEPLKRLGRPKCGFRGRMGRSWTPLGALLEAFGAQKTLLGSALGRPKGEETGFEFPGGQMGAQKGPRRVLKLAPQANQVENGETTNIVDNSKDFLDF